jgi:hypothetical protein
MSIPDIYSNHIGTVLCIAPTTVGRFATFAQVKRVSLYRETQEVGEALSRWLFSDFPQNTLVDEWGNRYNHQVHTLLAGSLKEGEDLLSELEAHGCTVIEASGFFVPLQNVEIQSTDSSDQLRQRHPRAFALARRDCPDRSTLLTLLKDSSMFDS